MWRRSRSISTFLSSKQKYFKNICKIYYWAKRKFPKRKQLQISQKSKGRAVMPYIDDSDSQIDDGWNKGCNLVHAETIRENPENSLLNIINRSKTATERQENARQNRVRIAKCKKSKDFLT
ncbi:unnamed protein product [Blepharisma stoltei]|uniref:Uncharacterized protein n=1 Tax=Blepharisma stoltei TaxID=1481888 RepID=A0AAU9KBL7_9CILI|nr:unnamed protein product [Blepharisma stoltei]